jgi:uncharacterized protein (TIGR03435 family)
MKRPRFAIALTTLLLSCGASGQMPNPTPLFENADVHAAVPGVRTQAMGRFRPGARFEAAGFTILDLLERAYGVADRDWIVGGPAWIGIDRFDIVASVPAGPPQPALQPMLQALLADRFKLVVHNDRKPMPVYVLAAGKRLLLKESSGGESRCSFDNRSEMTMTCTNMGMEQFARALYDSADYFDRPLFDKTGLTGAYDFALHWTPRARMAGRNGDGQPTGTSVFDAVDKPLG